MKADWPRGVGGSPRVRCRRRIRGLGADGDQDRGGDGETIGIRQQICGERGAGFPGCRFDALNPVGAHGANTESKEPSGGLRGNLGGKTFRGFRSASYNTDSELPGVGKGLVRSSTSWGEFPDGGRR